MWSKLLTYIRFVRLIMRDRPVSSETSSSCKPTRRCEYIYLDYEVRASFVKASVYERLALDKLQSLQNTIRLAIISTRERTDHDNRPGECVLEGDRVSGEQERVAAGQVDKRGRGVDYVDK